MEERHRPCARPRVRRPARVVGATCARADHGCAAGGEQVAGIRGRRIGRRPVVRAPGRGTGGSHGTRVPLAGLTFASVEAHYKFRSIARLVKVENCTRR